MMFCLLKRGKKSLVLLHEYFLTFSLIKHKNITISHNAVRQQPWHAFVLISLLEK